MCDNIQKPLHESSSLDPVDGPLADQALEHNAAEEVPSPEKKETTEKKGSKKTGKTAEKPHEVTAAFEAFKKELEGIADVETKLHKVLEFMKSSISHGPTPQFKQFWEAKSCALLLFKENVDSALRSMLWNQYTDLSKEAKQLKDLLDEESAFASEQIELAIKSVEDEIEASTELLKQEGKHPDLPLTNSETLKNSLPFYKKLQTALNTLNAQAARINALRKELIKTEMRIRTKNKFFQRLSQAGDKVFPLRKELIGEISKKFSGEIDEFISKNFQKLESNDAMFYLRDEIKALQNVAKELTLNTHAFTETRLKLSKCWDQLKVVEKEKKKERALQKTAFKQNAQLIDEKLNDLSSKFNAKEMNFTEALKGLDAILLEMRAIELGRDEVRYLKDKISDLKKPLFEEKQKEINEQEKEELLRQNAKKQALQNLFDECESLSQRAKSETLESLTASYEALQEKIGAQSISRNDKADLERRLRPVREAVIEKRESAVLALSDDDRSQLIQLKTLLEERKARRQEVKGQIQALRRSIGGSGLDIAQSLALDVELAEEKIRLEKISSGVDEVERKIKTLEAKK